MIWLYPRQCSNIFSLLTTQIYLPMITKLKKGHKIEGLYLSNKLILNYTFNLGCHHGRQFIQNSFFQTLFFTDNMIIFFLPIYYLMYFFLFLFKAYIVKHSLRMKTLPIKYSNKNLCIQHIIEMISIGT